MLGIQLWRRPDFVFRANPSQRHGLPRQRRRGVYAVYGQSRKKDYSSAFEKKNETAELGKYSVVLDDAKARVELTANETVALYRIKYLADNGGIFFDFQTGMMGNIANRVVESDIKLADEYTIVGTQKVRAFTRRDISFAVKFDKPVRELIEIERPKNHKAPRWSLLFGLKSGDELKVKISVSTVGIDGALKNLSALEHWDFDNVAKRTREQWNAILSRISVDAPAERKKYSIPRSTTLSFLRTISPT